MYYFEKRYEVSGHLENHPKKTMLKHPIMSTTGKIAKNARENIVYLLPTKHSNRISER